ncbi:MAG: PrsW family intramembrane metalloprotease [Acholeplasmatales bacterium]|nr:PrsW family intramembrane metalloprotease [Acholeplasmatales bacterium]
MNELEGKKLNKKDYLFIFLVFGLAFTTVLIIICELSWDGICKAAGWEKSLSRELIECFLRAALIEEFFKFLGFILARKKYKINRVSDSMFAAGLIGLMYGIVEKAVLFNPMAIIINIFFPMHLLWQWNQGRHFQIAIDEKKKGNNGKAFLHMFLATFVIFFLHGAWDALISIGVYMMDEKNAIQNGETIGGIILGSTLLLGAIYTIVTFIITIKTARKSKRESEPKEIEETKELKD